MTHPPIHPTTDHQPISMYRPSISAPSSMRHQHSPPSIVIHIVFFHRDHHHFSHRTFPLRSIRSMSPPLIPCCCTTLPTQGTATIATPSTTAYVGALGSWRQSSGHRSIVEAIGPLAHRPIRSRAFRWVWFEFDDLFSYSFLRAHRPF